MELVAEPSSASYSSQVLDCNGKITAGEVRAWEQSAKSGEGLFEDGPHMVELFGEVAGHLASE